MTTPEKQVNPWVALVPVCVGFFLIMMDMTIVNVAIPSMLADLDADLNQMAWVNSVYLLTYAVPLLVSGRLGDRLGRKQMFQAGMVVFTAASLWCGAAGSAEMLIVARAAQGFGAAMMAPQTMALVTTLFPPHRIGAALGVWGAVAGLASAVGPLLGGFLVGSHGWEWIFLVNVPVGLAGLVMTVFLLPDNRQRVGRRFDALGTVLSGLGLLTLVFGLQNGQHYAWGSVAGPVTVPVILAAGVLLLIAFVVWQRRNTREPLMPLRLFRQRNFSAAVVAATCVGFAVTGMSLPIMLYLQSVMELSPQQAGALMLPAAVASGAAGPFAGMLSDRFGGKWVVLGGFLVFALGLVMIAAAMESGASTWCLGLALFVMGLGSGASFAPLAHVATSGVRPELMGAASGIYNQLRQVGCVVGSAAGGVLLQMRIAAELPGSETSAGSELAPSEAAPALHGGLADAVGSVLLLPVAVLLLGSAACLVMRSRPRVADTSAAGATTASTDEAEARTGTAEPSAGGR
ncbi:DHA2 family efflux MFS transporter permease subunit [Streptomyces sp. NPDC056149]|uniref:DHA2 family efflux MFS transporter permease subunit n=1 Tax=Streptomyces sp. NPDC056149 TaxID=3345728 RepID=UPI0035DA78D1